jgi:peptidoglycan/LPS O-acetylase OafA/YrhL
VGSKASHYRPEIEGLRAVAALLVAVYHIWMGRVSGGVDVFFVVSAYLITTLLLRQVERTGTISFVTFWGGLARRLLPMAMLVLFTIIVASVLWLPRPLWDETIQQTLASIVYLTNWQLAYDAVDYLQQGQSSSPVQHYWALSLQGQFYLFWPLIFAAALLIARRASVSFKVLLAGIFGVIFLASLAFSIVQTHANQTFTYFSTLARLWEFCMGAFLALAPAIKLNRGTRALFSWIGLIGIISCGMILQVSQVFPGYAALWPVGCGVLIMMAGNSGSRFGADRLLSWQPLVALGSISYALYLWHWPVLIFYRWFTHHGSLSLAEGCVVLGIALSLAALSTRMIEQPIRLAPLELGKPRRLAKFVAYSLAPVLLISCAWGGFYLDQRQRDERPIVPEHPDYPGARALESGFRYQGGADVPLYPGMLAIEDNVPVIYRDGCYRPDPDWQRTHCIYGDRNSTRTLALVGGSHSVHWLPALDRLARQHGWRIVVYSKNKCLFSVSVATIQQDEWCEQWNQRTLEILLQDRPQLVFTTSTRGSGAQEHVPLGFLQRWEQMRAAGIKVIAVRDTPWMKIWVPECLEMKGHESPHCAQPADAMLSSVSPVERVRQQAPDVHFIDLTEYFCIDGECPPVIGNLIVYRDDSHMTVAYARTLAPMLGREIASALPPGWLRHL